MAKPDEAPGAKLLDLWHRWHTLPGGRWLFSYLLGWRGPYSGSIRPQVKDLGPGHARVEMADRRRVRNHLNSVHALALANLGEMASGLAMLCALPSGVRGIVVGISIEYFKKARGRLVATSESTVPEVTGDTEYEVQADIRDPAGDTVARVTVRWRLGLVEGAAQGTL